LSKRAPEAVWEWDINSEPARVKQTVGEILARLDEAAPGQTLEERGDLKLIFSELLYNAIIHGNNSDPDKKVRISLQVVNGRQVNAGITDEGPGFDYQQTVSRDPVEGLYSETGRGIQIVNALADKLSFDSSGRRVMFEKRVGALNG
jgi:serine/threonine-protein kinase RsbW